MESEFATAVFLQQLADWIIMLEQSQQTPKDWSTKLNVAWKTRIRNASNFDNANYNEDYDEENMKNIKKSTAVQNLFSSDEAQDAALQST